MMLIGWPIASAAVKPYSRSAAAFQLVIDALHRLADHRIVRMLDDGREFLGRLLRLAPLRYVAKHQHRAQDPALLVEDRSGAIVDRPFLAILCNQHGVIHQSGDRTGGDHLRDRDPARVRESVR